MFDGGKMEKSILKIVAVCMVVFVALTAEAQVYRYNPQTGGSENISQPANTATTPQAATRPAAKKVTPAQVNQLQKAVNAAQANETINEDGTSTGDLIQAVNQNIADEQTKGGRKMLPLGRIGIIINPEQYNPTIERNIAELNAIAGLDKLYLTPPMHIGGMVSLMKWQKLSGIEFISDTRNVVQEKFNITVPGFAYLRPDGTHTAYSLTDLAPFYEALTVQRRKVGK